ncbi:MAG: hypothetical protein ACQEP7_04850, partial [bacterium]
MSILIYGTDLLAVGLATVLAPAREVYLGGVDKRFFLDSAVYPSPSLAIDGYFEDTGPLKSLLTAQFSDLSLSFKKRRGYIAGDIKGKIKNLISLKNTTAAESREHEPRISTYLNRIKYSDDFVEINEKYIYEKFIEKYKANGGRLISSSRLKFEEPEKNWGIAGDKEKKIDQLIVTGCWPDNIAGKMELPGKGQVKKEVRVKIDALSSSPPEFPWFTRNLAILPLVGDQLELRADFPPDSDRFATAGEMLEIIHKSYEIFPFIYEEELDDYELCFRY